MNKDHHQLLAKVAGRQISDKGGYGVFATQPIAADELLMLWGGDVWQASRYDELTEQQKSYCLMIEEDFFLVSFRPGEGDWVNHSCDPTAWLVGQIILYSRRPIAVGEEITFDYATCDGRPDSVFTCECGSPLCRHKMTGNDWMLPELQARYAGHFMPYLQRRIDRLKAGK